MHMTKAGDAERHASQKLCIAAAAGTIDCQKRLSARQQRSSTIQNATCRGSAHLMRHGMYITKAGAVERHASEKMFLTAAVDSVDC